MIQTGLLNAKRTHRCPRSAQEALIWLPERLIT